MIRLEGKVYRGSALIAMDTQPLDEKHRDAGFSKRLDVALTVLCKRMGVPLPIWLNKNTKQFIRFRQTVFQPDQFAEKVAFDQFQIKLLEDER